MRTLNILAVGDIYGADGLAFAKEHLRTVKNRFSADLVIVNAENASRGNGTSAADAKELLDAGADALTGGNHSLRHTGFFTVLEDCDNVLRPLNFPELAPGRGHCILYGPEGVRVLLLNAQGQVFMDYSIDNPVTATERVLEKLKGEYDVAVCDFHAEATSEKAVFANAFDGRLSAVWGTHTHVQTADERILPGGTGFLSDLGMTGVADSIIGGAKEGILAYYRTHVRTKIEDAKGVCALHGALFTIDASAGRCTGVKRIQFGKESIQ